MAQELIWYGDCSVGNYPPDILEAYNGGSPSKVMLGQSQLHCTIHLQASRIHRKIFGLGMCPHLVAAAHYFRLG